MDLSYLKDEMKKVVGTKQTTRALREFAVKTVFIAEDADSYVTNKIVELCNEQSIEVIKINSMKELGKICGIDVKAACAALLK